MTLLERLRYKWISLTNGTAQFGRIKQEAVRQLIGHTRIIGWENGLPVRSLTIPAEYSRANALMMARLYNSIRPAVQLPGVMSLSITNRCDCECPHCCAAGQDGDELPADAWREIIARGLELGVFSCVITGGEPLLRDDLGGLIGSIDPDRATCLVYTNGSRLADRARELYAAGLRRVAIAVDFADGREHDEHRRHKGLYEKAVQGCQEAKRLGMLVGISTFASPQRLENGVLAGIFELARRLEVHEIFVYDLLPSGRLSGDANPGTGTAEYRNRFRGGGTGTSRLLQTSAARVAARC